MEQPKTIDDEVERILEDWRRHRPDLDPSPMGVFGRIARIAARQRADLNNMLIDDDLTAASFDVLASLRRSEPPHRKTPTELASSSMMSTGGMTFRIDKLEASGFISRHNSPEDRRVVYVQLTDAGRDLIDRVMEAHLDRERSLLASVSGADVEQLAKLLALVEISLSDAHI